MTKLRHFFVCQKSEITGDTLDKSVTCILPWDCIIFWTLPSMALWASIFRSTSKRHINTFQRHISLVSPACTQFSLPCLAQVNLVKNWTNHVLSSLLKYCLEISVCVTKQLKFRSLCHFTDESAFRRTKITPIPLILTLTPNLVKPLSRIQ